MKEVVVLSGKGGTGKTSFTAAFSHLAKDIILTDLDVDAGNLGILFPEKQSQSKEDFHSGFFPVIDSSRCTLCGACQLRCPYSAVSCKEATISISPLKCEGCGTCEVFCPNHAINMITPKRGTISIHKVPQGTLINASMETGGENSGKLVANIREKARKIANELKSNIILADGPPGIGCPAIASITGTDFAVFVTEPTPSGVHDLKRGLELAKHFSVKTGICINKCDLSTTLKEEIRDIAQSFGSDLLGEIPFCSQFPESQRNLKTIFDTSETEIQSRIKSIWNRILNSKTIKETE
jgi:MinD superfamily P-loop ATPase